VAKGAPYDTLHPATFVVGNIAANAGELIAQALTPRLYRVVREIEARRLKATIGQGSGARTRHNGQGAIQALGRRRTLAWKGWGL
jgi:hypothetical protein